MMNGQPMPPQAGGAPAAPVPAPAGAAPAPGGAPMPGAAPGGDLSPEEQRLMASVDQNNPLQMLLLRRLDGLSPEEGEILAEAMTPEIAPIMAKFLPEIAPFIMAAVPFQRGGAAPGAGGAPMPAAPGGAPMPGGGPAPAAPAPGAMPGMGRLGGVTA